MQASSRSCTKKEIMVVWLFCHGGVESKESIAAQCETCEYLHQLRAPKDYRAPLRWLALRWSCLDHTSFGAKGVSIGRRREKKTREESSWKKRNHATCKFKCALSFFLPLEHENALWSDTVVHKQTHTNNICSTKHREGFASLLWVWTTVCCATRRRWESCD